MARRDVIKSRQSSIVSRSKPGAAARTYASAGYKYPGGRSNQRTEAAVAGARKGNPLHPSQNVALSYLTGKSAVGEGVNAQSDPRMGYRYETPISRQTYGTMGSTSYTTEDATRAPYPVLRGLVSPQRSAELDAARDRERFGDISGGARESGYGFFDGQFNVPGVTDSSAYDDFMDAKYDEISDLIEMRNLAIQQGQDDVAAAYNDQISAIQGDIADAKQSKADVAQAFARYRGTVDPYLSASVEAADNTDLSGIAELQGNAPVTQQFNSGVAAVDDVLARIGPENADLAAAMEGQVREFQAMAEDAMREDMSSVYRIAEQGQKFAEATALAMQQQDITMTDVERQKIEVDINAHLDRLADQLADTQKAKSDAMAAAAKQIGDAWDLPDFYGSSDEAFAAVLGSFMDIRDLTPEDRDIMQSIIGDMRQEGIGDRKSAEAYLREAVQFGNLDALDEAAGGQLEDWLRLREENGDTVTRGLLYQWAANPKSPYQGTVPPGMASLLSNNPDLEGLDTLDDYRYALDAWDLYREHNEKWNDNQAYSKTYGHALADSYGYQGGTTGSKGKAYEGQELNQLLYDAAVYVYGGDEGKARTMVESGAMQRIIKSESGGYVGRLNYAGTAELRNAGVDVRDGYNTQAFLKYLESAGKGQFGAAGWPAGKNGKRHSASGLGQLNANNYVRYASEFGGASAVGNPFAEAVAAIRYADAAHGNVSRALGYKLANGNW